MNWKRRALLFLAVMVLSACATIPKGPSVGARPGPWKPLEIFQADDAACRRWGTQQSGTPCHSLLSFDDYLACRQSEAQESGTSQNRYDYVYQQCMYAKGNQIPGLSPSRQAAPLTPPPPQVQPAGKPLTNDDIISLVRTGLSEAIIVSVIQKSPTQFDLDPEALVKLKEAGISNTVIEAMIGRRGP